MSQLEMLAGRINALLDGLWMLVCVVGAVISLVCTLMLIAAVLCGDWTVRLAVVSYIACSLLSIILAPLVPYGNIVGVCIIVLGVSIAYWIMVYH